MSCQKKTCRHKPVPPTLQQAIQKLRETERMLTKKQEYLERKIDQEYVSATKNALNNKPAALQALRRKKRYEKQLQQIDNTLTTVELQRETLEKTTITTAVLSSMKNAAVALKSAQANTTVEKIYKLIDDISDQQEFAQEISNAISNPVGFDADVDEDELEAELEALEAEAWEEKLLEVPHSVQKKPQRTFEKLPVPVKAKAKSGPSKENDTDPDIKKLEEWAS